MRAVPLGGKETLQYLFQFRYMRASDIPNLIQIDNDVVVDEDITHSADRPPIN